MKEKLKNKNIRRLRRQGGSYSLTVPIEIMNALGWRENQKVVFAKSGQGIKIRDWKE